MVTLHPNILEKDGKKEFAVLPFDEYVAVKEELQNYEDLKDLKDLKDLREAKEKEGDVEGVSLSEAKDLLGI